MSRNIRSGTLSLAGHAGHLFPFRLDAAKESDVIRPSGAPDRAFGISGPIAGPQEDNQGASECRDAERSAFSGNRPLDTHDALDGLLLSLSVWADPDQYGVHSSLLCARVSL